MIFQNNSQENKISQDNTDIANGNLKDRLSCNHESEALIERKRLFREKLDSKTLSIKTKYDELISKADTQERKDQLAKNCVQFIKGIKESLIKEFNLKEDEPIRDYSKEALLKIDRENKFRAGINPDKEHQDFKKISNLKINALSATEYNELPSMKVEHELRIKGVKRPVKAKSPYVKAIYKFSAREELQRLNKFAIPVDILKALDLALWLLPRSAYEVLKYIFEHFYTAKFYESRLRIARKLGYCIRTITRAFAKLRALGFIRVYYLGYFSNHIVINKKLRTSHKEQFVEALDAYNFKNLVRYGKKRVIKVGKALNKVITVNVQKLKQLIPRVSKKTVRTFSSKLKEKLLSIGVDERWCLTLRKFREENIEWSIAQVFSRKSAEPIRCIGALIHDLCRRYFPPPDTNIMLR